MAEASTASLSKAETIVVTGAGGGIGSATVGRLADAGYDVVAVDLAGAGLDALTGKATVVEADVTISLDWLRVAEVVEGMAPLAGLVNNAGIEGAIVPLVEYPEEMFDRVLAVNVKGVWLGMKTFGPVLAANGGGSIVNIASVAGLRGARNISAYVASKHAVVGLTRTAALEFSPDQVRVNAVCPSPIRTRMMGALEDAMKTDDATSEDIAALIAAGVPLGRYGQPAEVADLITFLLSGASQYMTGAAIPIDGGHTA